MGSTTSTRTLIPKQETQLYFLARNAGTGSLTANAGAAPQAGGASPRDIYTFGLRVKSLPKQFGGWDYEAEIAGQFGRLKETAVSVSLDQEALAAHVAGGYTWTSAFGTPRVGLEYNYASGDDNPNDNKHETFDNLFPTNHKFYGYMDFVSLQNIHEARVSSSLRPVKQWTVTLDYHAFWLADTLDSFYTVARAAWRAGADARQRLRNQPELQQLRRLRSGPYRDLCHPVVRDTARRIRAFLRRRLCQGVIGRFGRRDRCQLSLRPVYV